MWPHHELTECRRRWNEWITLPIRYCDLPLNAQITFTVWDIAGLRAAMPVGGTTFRLFGKKCTLRRGKHRLLLWPNIEADGSVESTTPSKLPVRDEMGRLEKLVKKYERGDLPKSDWLDKLAFRKMAEVHAVRKVDWRREDDLTFHSGRDQEV